MNLQEQLSHSKGTIEYICQLIESGNYYMDELNRQLIEIDEIVDKVLKMSEKKERISIDETFVLLVLKDIIYGIEHKDSVILLDTLRYGLLKIYDDIEDGLAGKYE